MTENDFKDQEIHNIKIALIHLNKKSSKFAMTILYFA